MSGDKRERVQTEICDDSGGLISTVIQLGRATNNSSKKLGSRGSRKKREESGESVGCERGGRQLASKEAERKPGQIAERSKKEVID